MEKRKGEKLFLIPLGELWNGWKVVESTLNQGKNPSSASFLLDPDTSLLLICPKVRREGRSLPAYSLGPYLPKQILVIVDQGFWQRHGRLCLNWDMYKTMTSCSVFHPFSFLCQLQELSLYLVSLKWSSTFPETVQSQGSTHVGVITLLFEKQTSDVIFSTRAKLFEKRVLQLNSGNMKTSVAA